MLGGQAAACGYWILQSLKLLLLGENLTPATLGRSIHFNNTPNLTLNFLNHIRVSLK